MGQGTLAMQPMTGIFRGRENSTEKRKVSRTTNGKMLDQFSGRGSFFLLRVCGRSAPMKGQICPWNTELLRLPLRGKRSQVSLCVNISK